MKEKIGNNSVRSFEAYEKMMKESKSKSRVVQNNENDILTVRDNTTGNRLQRSTTSRGTLKLTKSPQKQQKPLSPNRHKNHNHSPMKTVPYSQIQLILESIDSIKNKAKQQISQWTTKNKQLSVQNEKLRRQITRVKQSQLNLMQQHKNAIKQQQSLGQQCSRKQSDMAVRLRIWNEQKHQYIQEMLNVKQANRLLEEQVGELEARLEEEVRIGQQWKQKYDELVDKLTVGKSQRLSELIYQLQTKHSQSSIMDTLQQLQIQNLLLQKQCQKHLNQISSTQQRCLQQKQQRLKLQQMLSNLMQQNRKLIQSLSLKEGNFNQQRQSLREEVNEVRGNMEQMRCALESQLERVSGQMQGEIGENRKTIQHLEQIGEERQHIIEELKRALQQLQHTLYLKQLQIASRIEQKQKLQLHYRYFDVVDEQCQQLQDMTRIVAKLEIIQKIKLQNQTNIQKIQFLSKMLDC